MSVPILFVYNVKTLVHFFSDVNNIVFLSNVNLLIYLCK